MIFAKGQAAGIPSPRAVGATIAFIALCGLPYVRWWADPSLFDDDFLRVGSLRRSSLGEALFRPFNEHMAPLFEVVSWLAWQASGRRVLAVPRAFEVASYLAFATTLGLLAAIIWRELRSRTAALMAVAAFCLSAVSAETVLWYSASSFQWAASATLAAWLAGSMASGPMTPRGRLGWLLASGVASLMAPAFSAIGILAGPVAAVRIAAGADRPASVFRRLAGSAVPILGTVAYLFVCQHFRYGELVSASVGRNLSPWPALWATLRAPSSVLLPSIFGLTDLAGRFPGWLQAGMTLAGLAACLAWAARSRDRPIILGALTLIVGGYLSTYATRARPGDPSIFAIGRYHLFPVIGLIWLVAAAAATCLRRLDADPSRPIVAAACLAAALAGVQYPRMAAASALAYRHPDQPRALAAASRLEAICDRLGVTLGQTIAALEPTRTLWYPRPGPFNPLLHLFPVGPSVSKVPDRLVRSNLIAALSPEDRGAIFGGMDATRHRVPGSAWAGPRPPIEARHVGGHRLRPIGPGCYRSEGATSDLEFTVGPEADGARAIGLPGIRARKAVEIWWAGEGDDWSPDRRVCWSPDPPGDWIIPVDALPTWGGGRIRRVRVVVHEWGPVAVGAPRFYR